MTDAPYPLEELQLKAPFEAKGRTVPKEWTDWNGHMNVGYYVVAFDHATGDIFNNFGLPYEYTKFRIGMYFVLEGHVNYEKEIKEGDAFRIETQILDHDLKRVHLFHSMYDAGDGKLVATNELMLMNIDYESRRSAPWPLWANDRIERMAALHRTLPRPRQVGSVIAIRSSQAPASSPS